MGICLCFQGISDYRDIFMNITSRYLLPSSKRKLKNLRFLGDESAAMPTEGDQLIQLQDPQ